MKEPVNLTVQSVKRPDGATLLPWATGKPLAWDVTVPDTFADSHIGDTATEPAAAANKAAVNKIAKYGWTTGKHPYLPSSGNRDCQCMEPPSH